MRGREATQKNCLSLTAYMSGGLETKNYHTIGSWQHTCVILFLSSFTLAPCWRWIVYLYTTESCPPSLNKASEYHAFAAGKGPFKRFSTKESSLSAAVVYLMSLVVQIGCLSTSCVVTTSLVISFTAILCFVLPINPWSLLWPLCRACGYNLCHVLSKP